MKLVTPKMIPEIDRFAIEELGISEIELMRRSAEAVKKAIKNEFPDKKKVLILAGKGNNGGDGYALSALMNSEYDISVYDLFSSGQRSSSGKFYLNEYIRLGGRVNTGFPCKEALDNTDVVVDAIFGTGFCGELSEELISFSNMLSESNTPVVAIDVPLGVDAEFGRVLEGALKADLTVELSYMKVGLLSYPARQYLGKIYYSDLDLPGEKLEKSFTLENYLVDKSEAKILLPKRRADSNKGSFGKALLITGSSKYEGAGRLSLEAALRGGAGITTFISTVSLRDRFIPDFPEAIYEPLLDYTKESTEKILAATKKHNAILIGSGSGVSEKLYNLIREIINTEGAPVVLDADALNSIALYGADVLKKSKRKLVLTPHPMEFSRLTGISVEEINSNRLQVAKAFCEENNCILLLKGAATVITDGKTVYINSTGSSALAKGGSGDALAGLLVSLIAFSSDPLKATALSAYIHGEAGDRLSSIYSDFGVTPKDLPKEMAKVIRDLEIG